MGRGRTGGDARRNVLVVAVVLAVIAASGGVVYLTAPDLLDKLGLTSAPAVALPPVPQAALRPLADNAPVPTPAGLAKALDEAAAAMPGEFAGIVVDPATGEQVWGSSPQRSLVPGSTGKLLTGAAALLTLNPTDRLVTRVVAGPQPDTVVLIGGGDPTLTAASDPSRSVYPDPPRISDLAAKVKEATKGQQIKRVLVDTGRYTGPGMAPGWAPTDVAAGFVTPITSLMLDGGRINPSVLDTPRVSDPADTAARAFAEELGAGSVAEGSADASAPVLATASSAPISELVEFALRASDNVLAEVLAREVAIAADDEGSFEGGARQVLTALDQAGLDTTGVRLVDGSGLSPQDEVSPRLLGSLVAKAAAPAQGPVDSQFLRPIISGLPVAGGQGTLDDRYARGGAAAAGRGIVRAKTGSLTNVSSLAGIVTDADGKLLVFALMSNGANPGEIRPRHDAMAATLSRCGCP